MQNKWRYPGPLYTACSIHEVRAIPFMQNVGAVACRSKNITGTFELTSLAGQSAICFAFKGDCHRETLHRYLILESLCREFENFVPRTERLRLCLQNR